MSRYERFDRRRLELRPLALRGHDLAWSDCQPLRPPAQPFGDPELPKLVEHLLAARCQGRPVVLMLGAHPVKLGLSRFLIDLVDRRLVTHLATNGAGLIHDFELALAGGTSEDVARWIRVGQFGLWRETGRLKDLARQAAARDEGFGEAAGRVVEEEGFPHRDLSLAAAAWRGGIPFTCHIGIGSDTLHGLPNCDGAALGKAALTDFLIFARAIQELEGGAFLNVGSAVTGPEVFLKALSMARNVARREGAQIRDFTTAVFDLVPLPAGYRDGPPPKDDPMYYYRPWKTLLVRTVAGGGRSYYLCGDHRQSLPTLWHQLASAGG
jgi:hypothetical protein